MGARSHALPVLASGEVKPEIKVCRLGRYHAAKLHLAIGGKTLCGRDSFTHLRKTKFDFSQRCCKFCCSVAIPQKLGEMRGSGHPAIAGSRRSTFPWLRKTARPSAYPHRDRGWE